MKDEPVSETHSNIRGKALKVKDYSIPNLVKRFQFTLVGRENTERPAVARGGLQTAQTIICREPVRGQLHQQGRRPRLD